MAEHSLGKGEVVGSIPIAGSIVILNTDNKNSEKAWLKQKKLLPTLLVQFANRATTHKLLEKNVKLALWVCAGSVIIKLVVPIKATKKQNSE